MAQKLRCPKCKTVVKLPDKRDSTRCPECSKKLTASSHSDRRDGLPKKKKKKPGVSKTLIYSILGGVAGVVVLVPVIFGIVWLIKAERRVVVPLVKDGPKNERPDDGRQPPIMPPIPVGPVEPPSPAMWKAKPDPATAREPLPDTIRWPLGNAEPLFASADGPFVVDMPFSRVNERFKDKVIDLRTGKEIGSFGKNSPVHSTGGSARLSPDGQYVAGSENKKVEVWKIGSEEPMLKLDLPSYPFWLDFRNAEELVAVTIDNKKPLVVVWKIADGKERHKVTLPQNQAFDKGSVGTNAKFSPGRKQLAVAVQGELHLVDLEAGAHVGTASRPTGSGLGFLFSNDGAELTGVYYEKTGNAGRHSLVTWNMNNGKLVRPPTDLNVPNMSSMPIPGPDGETLIFRNDYRFQTLKVAPGQVVDRSTGTSIYELEYIPVRWEGKGRLLAYRPIDETAPLKKQNRELMVVEFDQKQFLAKSGGARGAVAERPKAIVGDRKDVKTLKPAPGAWAVRVGATPAPLGLGKVDLEEGDITIARTAKQASSVFMLNARKPIQRTSLNWSRYDLETGKPIGEPFELWPWLKRDDNAMPPADLGELPAAMSPDGKWVVVRDPAHPTWSRVDVWDSTGKRVLGLTPYRDEWIEWHGWTNKSDLLTLGDGKLTAWDVSSGKAIFEINGDYAGKAELAPDGSCLIVPSPAHIDVLDATTGACLGRLDNKAAKARSWKKFAFSPDGKRLASVSWAEKTNCWIYTWDLTNGKIRDVIPLPKGGPGTALWYGERRLLLSGSDIVDLDLRTTVATSELPAAPSRPLLESPDGRLWLAGGSLKPEAYARSIVEEQPGIRFNGWRRTLVVCPTPDPNVIAEVPAVAPAKRTVVFHPGIDIGIDVDCKSPDRADQMRAAMAELLRRDGYKIGKGSGWKIAMQAEQLEIPLKFNFRVALVPGVKGSVNLVGPDGPAGGGEIKRDVSNLKSKYELKRDKDGHRFFDFEGENAYKCFENEYWDAWIAQLDSVRWPRAVMRSDGKYAPLPAKVRLEAVK